MALDVPQTDFWNDKDRDKKCEALRVVLDSENQSVGFEDQSLNSAIGKLLDRNECMKSICFTLPSIEYHWDGKAVAKMKENYQWLEDLEPSSTSSFERLREEFFKNAPAFLDRLDSFTNWKRIESQMSLIFGAKDDGTLMKALLLTIENLKDLRRNTDDCSKNRTGDKSLAATCSEILNMYQPNELTSSRLEDLFGKVEVATSKAHQYVLQTFEDRVVMRSSFLASIVQIIWEEGKNTALDCWLLIKRFNNGLGTYHIHPLWCHYEQRIKAFVRQVGCAKSHETPEENIAELRLFHSTTIGYFAELQVKYFKTELKLKELRRQITALEFRHLLEHLPDPKLHPNAGPRWIKFWNEALMDEAAKARTRATKHALTDIMEDRNPKRHHEEVTTQSATVAVEGARLYNKLSDEIHRCRGTEYRVGEPGDWDVAISDILKALKPENVQANGDVDWVTERKRYISTATATNKSDDKAFSWNTVTMRERINALEKHKDQMQGNIGDLKRETRSLKKDLKAIKPEDSDEVIGDFFDIFNPL